MRIFFLIAFSLFGTLAYADSEQLTNDQSRSQLFELMRSYLVEAAPTAEKKLYAFPKSFEFPDDALWNNPILRKDPRVDQIFGIDLSHHNADNCKCLPNWQALAKQHVHYAYLKVSQGTHNFDKYFEQYRDGARKLPKESQIHVGSYHFLTADENAEEQATYFLKLINGKLATDDLPPTLDLEWDVRVGNDGKIIRDSNGKPHDYWSGNSSDEILKRALAWLNLVKAKTGRTPIVYTNWVWWKERVIDAGKISLLNGFPIWISDYSKSGRAQEIPNIPKNWEWSLWQFTDSGGLKDGGFKGPGKTVDVNIFNGSLGKFRTTFGIPQ